MADYVKITDYAAKDALLTGNPAKLVRGAEIGADFDAVATAVATKADTNSETFTNINIDSGTIDGTVIGGSSAAAATVTSLTVTTGDVTIQGAGKGVIFEGTTADDFETTLTGGEPTADRTITMPNASGEVVIGANGVSGSAFSFRNKIINGGFTVNQRGYVSGAVLAAGSYGHDRFKAGASGGDYTFTQLASPTTITIASGKSLIQVIEDKNVASTSYVLSWTGTAQARYAVNSATPSGSYAASPILITGQTVGTVMSIEFNTGTLGTVQLEPGAVATPFEHRPYTIELVLCQRYWQQSYASGTAAGATTTTEQITGRFGYIDGVADLLQARIGFIVSMRAASTVTLYSPATGTSGKIRNVTGAGDLTMSASSTSTHGFGFESTSNLAAVGDQWSVHWTAGIEL